MLFVAANIDFNFVFIYFIEILIPFYHGKIDLIFLFYIFFSVSTTSYSINFFVYSWWNVGQNFLLFTATCFWWVYFGNFSCSLAFLLAGLLAGFWRIRWADLELLIPELPFEFLCSRHLGNFWIPSKSDILNEILLLLFPCVLTVHSSLPKVI